MDDLEKTQEELEAEANEFADSLVSDITNDPTFVLSMAVVGLLVCTVLLCLSIPLWS